jgi:hypothetical protein
VIPSRRTLVLKAARHVVREVAAAPSRLEPLPRARPRRTDRALGLVTHAGLYLAVAAAVVAFFSAALGHGGWQGWLRIAIGAVLALEGALLATDWHGARRLLLARLHARSSAPASFATALRWRALGLVLALAAVGAVCGGCVLIGFGVQDLT